MKKRLNMNKKKKGFTLIELIIVLAVMAIIAAIAIPNFNAVRDNSKSKADIQSCETIKRAVMMLVADETIVRPTTNSKIVTFTDGDDASPGYTTWTDPGSEHSKVMEAVKATKAPQSVKGVTETDGKLVADTLTNANKYKIEIDTNGVVKVTIVHV